MGRTLVHKPSMTFGEFFGQSASYVPSPEKQIKTRQVIYGPKLDDFKQFVRYFGGTVEVEAEEPRRFRVSSYVPDIMMEFFRKQATNSVYEYISKSDCIEISGKDFRLSC